MSHALTLAPTPPMGWNDWAHYRCGYTAQTILSNARALVKTGLAKRGYNTVTIDDCWMRKHRDANGNLQADIQRFPEGIKPVAKAVHALGLKFGIYEDAGYVTCAGLAGSGEAKGGGEDHFAQDAKLFASWGVDYLKLDGCSLYVPPGGDKVATYRKAYAAENAALKAVDRPIVFSESAPAYFMGTPDWYDVLNWVGDYGQLWREGTDVEVFKTSNPKHLRFHSVLWNYAYNLPLGRFQKPGNWNDADFIIGGDEDMSLSESRSQLALWAMMSAPLILSSDIDKLSPQAIAILGNKPIINVDQDPSGRMATLIRRNAVSDILLKPLSGGDYAISALNRGATSLPVKLLPSALGFSSSAGCRFNAEDLWSEARQPRAKLLQAQIASHDTAIWRIHPSPACGTPKRMGIVSIVGAEKDLDFEKYSHCLAATGQVEVCVGTPAETWEITASGSLKSAQGCLTAAHNSPKVQPCAGSKGERWTYTLAGNLINAADGKCLSATGNEIGEAQGLSMQQCGHNQRNQIWSLPN